MDLFRKCYWICPKHIHSLETMEKISLSLFLSSVFILFFLNFVIKEFAGLGGSSRFGKHEIGGAYHHAVSDALVCFGYFHGFS